MLAHPARTMGVVEPAGHALPKRVSWDVRTGRVDRFGPRHLPRQWQHRLHGCDGCLMRFQVTGTLPALRMVRQTRKAPSGLALLGRYWWAVDGYQLVLAADQIFWTSLMADTPNEAIMALQERQRSSQVNPAGTPVPDSGSIPWTRLWAGSSRRHSLWHLRFAYLSLWHS
jgi:hypothetical protein